MLVHCTITLGATDTSVKRIQHYSVRPLMIDARQTRNIQARRRPETRESALQQPCARDYSPRLSPDQMFHTSVMVRAPNATSATTPAQLPAQPYPTLMKL